MGLTSIAIGAAILSSCGFGCGGKLRVSREMTFLQMVMA